MADTALQDAIGEAATQLEEQIEQQEESEKKVEKEEKVEESEETEESEEETEEPVEEEESAEAQAQRESLILYNALKDPKTRGTVIFALAQEAGLRIGTAETKAEQKVEEKAIKQLVKETLGPEYKFLADKLGTVMEAVVGKMEEKNTEIRQEQAQQQILRETEDTLKKLERETKGESKKLESKMVSLMDKFPSGPNTSVNEYIRGIYAMASQGRTVATTKTQVADKIRNNSKNAPERMHSAGASDTEGIKEFTGKGSLKKAVEYAAQQLDSEGKLFRKK
jgi:hypothetical protein